MARFIARALSVFIRQSTGEFAIFHADLPRFSSRGKPGTKSAERTAPQMQSSLGERKAPIDIETARVI
jgi:hypothetical protein